MIRIGGFLFELGLYLIMILFGTFMLTTGLMTGG